MGIIEFSLKRRVTVAMAAVAVMMFGAVAFTRLPMNLLPDISYPSLTIESRFAGAPVTGPFPTYPADSPNNPVNLFIGQTIQDPYGGSYTFTENDLVPVRVYMRTVPNGNREGFQYFDDSSLFAGFEGTNDWFGGAEWDLGFEYARNRTLALTKNLANKVEIQNAIDDGSLDLFNVQGVDANLAASVTSLAGISELVGTELPDIGPVSS